MSVPDLHPSGRVLLSNISAHAWEHQTDRAALVALQQIPGFDSLLRKIVGTFGERNVTTLFTGAAVKVGPKQYSEIHESLVRVCEVLDTEVPPLYISQTPLVNAGAIGADNPIILLNSSLIELAEPVEIETVLGHEVGHIMSDHALYRMVLMLLLQFGGRMSPLVNQAVMPITLALLEWSRKAEISCDRAGLLSVQDLDAAMGVQAVLAGGVRGRRDQLSTEAFLEQADEFRGTTGLGSYYKFMATLGASHPFPVVRAAELRNWVDSGDYAAILEGTYTSRDDEMSPREEIGAAGRHFSDRATKVFEDSDQYVNDALTSFVESAKGFFSSSDD